LVIEETDSPFATSGLWYFRRINWSTWRKPPTCHKSL